MNLPLTAIQKPKIGACPHGLPAGACPICSGMGGGGGASRKSERPVGEMSWDECFAIGQMLKAQKLAQQQKEIAMLAALHTPSAPRISVFESAAQKISNLAQKLADFVNKSQANPTFLTKTLAFAAKIAVPVLNVLKNIPILAQKAVNFVQAKFADISDKLSAVFGELKKTIDKKLSDKFENFNKKLKSFFGVNQTARADNEDAKIEEEKRLFDLKTTFQNVKEKLFNNKDNIYADN